MSSRVPAGRSVAAPVRAYVAALTEFIANIEDDGQGYGKKVKVALDTAVTDAANAPAAYIRKLGRRARRRSMLRPTSSVRQSGGTG